MRFKQLNVFGVIFVYGVIKLLEFVWIMPTTIAAYPRFETIVLMLVSIAILALLFLATIDFDEKKVQ